jgi:hypothetical protein
MDYIVSRSQTRRIPDSTIFAHGRGNNKPFYPVIILENKPWPFQRTPFTISSVTAYRVHNVKPFKEMVAYLMLKTKIQAREQLLSIFHEHEHLQQVVYIYAFGAFFSAYTVTRDMVANDKVPPQQQPAEDEIQYLFADPGLEWNDGAGYDRPTTDDSINWCLDEDLIACWKGVLEEDLV